MAGSLSTRITIYADDKASASFRKVGKEADSLVSKLLGMGPKVGDVLGNLGVGSLGLGLSAAGITGFVKDISLAASRYDMLGIAMEQAGKNAGYTAEQVHAAEAAIVKNGIALDKSRQTITRLAAANVDLAKSSDLARTAQNLAVVANTDSSDAFDRLTHGIVSGQTQVLQNLGLFVNFQQEYAKAAQAMGKTAAGLTEDEKLQIRVNAALEAGSRYAGLYEASMTKAGKQLTSFARHWANLQTLLGEVTLDALATGIFGVNDSLESLNERLMQMKETGELEAVGKKIGNAFRSITENADNAAIAVAAWYAAVRVGNNETVRRLANLSKEHGAMATLRAEISGTTAMLGKDTAAYIANTQAVVANHQARLAAINRSIGAKQSVIAEISTPEYATNLEAIKHRRTLEREVKLLQGERVVVTRQLTQATNAMTVATSRGNIALRAMNNLKAGAMGLINALGGPWVLGITAATAAIYYLATQEDEATKYARNHAEAMQLVSQNADVAKASVERYAQRLAQMNARQREFEQADIQRSISDVIFGGEAYRTAVNSITPWAISDSNHAEIRKQASALAQVLLPSNFAAASVDDLKKARDEYVALATQFNRTKEAAEGLQAFDVLISLKQQAEIAAAAVSEIGDSAVDAANKLNALANVNFSGLTANVEFEIGKVGMSDRNRSVLDNLLRNKVLEQGQINIQGQGFDLSGLTPEAEANVRKLADAYGTLFDRQQDARTGSRGVRQSASATASALSGLTDELARLTMTEKEYSRYQYERKFSQLRKDIGATSPALAEWARLQESALNAGYTGSDAMATHIREVGKAISEMGLTEKEKQLKAFNDEMERLRAAMAAGISVPFTPEQLGAYEEQRGKEITTGRTVERDRQLLVEFEKEYLTVMQSSEAAQIASIQERAKAYEEAGASAVRVAEWQAEQELRYSRKATDGMRRALKDYASDATNAGKQVENLVTNSMSNMEDALVNFVRTGKLEFSSLVDAFISDLARMAIQQNITGPLAQGLGSFIGDMFGAGVQHSGGVIGAGHTEMRFAPASLFADAPRYHSGGQILRPGERPIIAEVGEVMLSNKDVVDIVKAKNSQSDAAPVNLTVALKNESGQPLQAQSQQTQWSNDMRSAVVTIVLDAVNRNYMGARDTLRG